MGTVILSGKLLFPDGVQEATIGVKDGIIDFVDIGSTSTSDDDTITGTIIPGLLDLHSHIGDHGARGYLPHSLEEVVFPGGSKEMFLEKASHQDMIGSIRSSLEEILPGVTRILDFREGGIEGIGLLEEATPPGSPIVYAFGRPKGEDDINELVNIASGIGIPCLVPGLEGIREICKRAKKPFSIHVSELFREDIGKVIELDPDLVIHMISGNKDDWGQLSERSIPVAVCPRANQAFGLDVPLKDMLDEGLLIGLGTDNALAVRQDMFREMESAWMLLRKGGSEGIEASVQVFDMAVGRTIGGSDLISMLPGFTPWWKTGWPRVGEPAHLSLIKGSTTDDHEMIISDIVRFKGQNDVSWTGPSE